MMNQAMKNKFPRVGPIGWIWIVLFLVSLGLGCDDPAGGSNVQDGDQDTIDNGATQKSAYQPPILDSPLDGSRFIQNVSGDKTATAIEYGQTLQGRLEDGFPFRLYIFSALNAASVTISLSAATGSSPIARITRAERMAASKSEISGTSVASAHFGIFSIRQLLRFCRLSSYPPSACPALFRLSRLASARP